MHYQRLFDSKFPLSHPPVFRILKGAKKAQLVGWSYRFEWCAKESPGKQDKDNDARDGCGHNHTPAESGLRGSAKFNSRGKRSTALRTVIGFFFGSVTTMFAVHGSAARSSYLQAVHAPIRMSFLINSDRHKIQDLVCAFEQSRGRMFNQPQSGVCHGYDRNDASGSKEPVSRFPRNASRHDRAMSRRTVDQRRLSQPVLADRLTRAVLHAFLSPAECGFLSSMGTSPDIWKTQTRFAIISR